MSQVWKDTDTSNGPSFGEFSYHIDGHGFWCNFMTKDKLFKFSLVSNDKVVSYVLKNFQNGTIIRLCLKPTDLNQTRIRI